MSSPPPGGGLPELSSLLPWRTWWHNPALRAWPVWVFVGLVAVPPLAIVFLLGDGDDLSAGTFAFYFAAAWFLLLRVAVRPQNLTGAMYTEIVVVALVTQVPLASVLEGVLRADLGNLASSIFAVGLPEELAKALPVVAFAVIHRSSWRALRPQDFLFLGAVSGLAFGARESLHYYDDYMPDVLARPEALAILWRFLTDPVSHALWGGVAGYFVGLAIRHRDPKAWAALTGLGIAIPATLHGLNDWEPVNSTVLWVALTIVSALLFLAYAKVGVAPAPSQETSSSTSTSAISRPVEPTRAFPAAWRRGPDGRWIRN